MPRIFSLPHPHIYVSPPPPTKRIQANLILPTSHKAAMAATGLLRTSRLLGLGLPSTSSSSSSSSYYSLNNSTLSSTARIRGHLSKVGDIRDERLYGVSEKNPLVAMKATVINTEPQTNRELDLASLLTKVANAALMILKEATKRRPWNLHAQMFIERGIVDCRFFTLFAVAGSLLGSVLCFVEGCFIVMGSYFQYFHGLSQRSYQGYVVQQLIEAIDMFLVGTAMLVFGMSLHVMFVGSRDLKGKSSQLPGSNLFGLFYLKTLPSLVSMQSVTQAKSKIGHAVMMILQVGVLEKFTSIPLVTGLDLACFSGAVFISSACIFLLSRLSLRGTMSNR